MADTGDGGSGIHYLVGEYTGELLPRLHLVLCHEACDVALHVVEGLLQGTLARQESFGRQAEGVVAVAYRLTHHEGTVLQSLLVTEEKEDDAARQGKGYTYYIYGEDNTHGSLSQFGIQRLARDA